MASSTFVDTALDADAVAVAARHVAEAAPGAADVATAVEGFLAGEVAPAALVARVLKQRGEVLGAPDAETFFLVLAATLAKVEGEGAGAVEGLADGLAAGEPGEHALARLRVLAAVFNVAPTTAARYRVLLAALRLAAAAKAPDAPLLPLLKRLDEWVRDWALTKAQMRELYAAVAATREAKGGKEHYLFLLKHLATFEAGAPDLAAATEEAVLAAKLFIGTPDLFQSDMLDLPAVKQLAAHPTHAPVHALLTIVLTGKLPAYVAWHAKNGAVLERLGLSHEALSAKMRLLSLVALGAESASGEIDYDTVQATLQCGPDEVETWIVRAIGAKVVDAKLDQVRRCCAVTRTIHPVFGAAQWADLRSRLASWQEVVEGVKSQVSALRGPAPAPPPHAPPHAVAAAGGN